jgi:Domain of unknown function (DUF5667)
MTSLIPARRRAERFDSLVEGGRRDDVDQTTSDLLELVGALRSVPEAEARPEFVADLRERLLLAAQTELTPARAARERDVERLTVRPTRTRRERRIALALGTVAVVGATTTMAYASQSAIPGDALYPLKRTIENTQVGFSHGDDAKGEAILGNASARLDEVGKLTQEKNPDAQLVTQTLNTFTGQATDASNHLLADHEQNGDAASIQQLHQFTQHSIDQLSALAPVVPHGAQAALENAAATLMTIDHAATDACPDCGDGITELPPQLVADAGHTLAGVTGAEAGGQLPGAGAGQPQTGHGGKGTQNPSGMNPPESPIQLPTQPSAAANPLGNVLPTPGSSPTGSGTGGPTGGATGGNGGGGKHHHAPVDLAPVTTPVTTAVNDVVTGVVEGVTGLLNGLTGGGN